MALKALVTNWTHARTFPTCSGSLRLAAHETRRVEGTILLGELARFPLLTFEMIKGPSGRLEVTATRKALATFRRPELRAMAEALGIPGPEKLTKAAVIAAIARLDSGRGEKAKKDVA